MQQAALQAHQQKSVICQPDNKYITENAPTVTNYLCSNTVIFTPFTQLEEPYVVPPEVFELFFKDFDGLGHFHTILEQKAHRSQIARQNPQRTHFYAVVDCSKAVSFPSRLRSAGRLENLYTGKLGQDLEEHAPYLLEFDAYQWETVNFLQRLFRKAESKVFSHWAANPVIFIRSQQPFDDVYRHLRKFTHLQNPDDKTWHFFRFYDPLVLNRYLPQLARYPAQLSALFGVKTNSQTKQQEQIIDAFGLRVDDEFIQFTLNPLPENTQPAKIELGKIEQKVFEQLAWDKFKNKLSLDMEKLYPNHINRPLWSQWLEEMKKKGLLTTERGYLYYLNGRILAEQKGQDYWFAWEQIQSKKQLSALDLTKKLMEFFNDV